MYDILIIGAGPAGLTAAIYAARAGKSVLLLEKETFGGQITHSPKVENYPGFLEMSGNQFAERLIDQAIAQGAEIELDRAISINSAETCKIVETESGKKYEARAVIIAAGSRHRHLGVEREDSLVGKGISYCAVCDGPFYAGKNVAIIGGGNTALQEAVMLSDICESVTLIQNLPYLTGEETLIEKLYLRDNVKFIFGSVVTSFIGEKQLEGLEIKKTSTDAISRLYVDGVFVAIGQEPENKPFENVAELNDYGYIVAGESCETGTPGIFVAGDCRTKAIRQIVTASGDGAVAAVAACKYVDNL
ncbi:MAG: FAD-dependent oxidoreductase [Ruminococcaceae bacterium]|nr:FAD-dependent oxidoreductase [Oscillospiraceae bacterium]